VSSFLAAYQHR